MYVPLLIRLFFSDFLLGFYSIIVCHSFPFFLFWFWNVQDILSDPMPGREFDFFPEYVTSIPYSGDQVEWSSPCFSRNLASLTSSSDGFELQIDVSVRFLFPLLRLVRQCSDSDKWQYCHVKSFISWWWVDSSEILIIWNLDLSFPPMDSTWHVGTIVCFV